MSKSKGTGVSPQVIIQKFGADVLRLWVSSTDYTEDAKFGPQILDRVADAYRKIRNTIRFMLGNLGGFNPETESVPADRMHGIDRWLMLRLQDVIDEARGGYETYEFARVYREVYGFCVTDLSQFYLDVLKDRLYASAPDSVARRSAQTALYHAAITVVSLIAPVLVFTADEAWQELRKVNPALPESVHLAFFPDMDDAWRDAALGEEWDRVLALRDEVNKALEEARTGGAIGKPLEARVTLHAAEPFATLADLGALREALNVSEVVLDPDAEQPAVEVGPAHGEKCPRCWLIKSDIGAVPAYPDLCARSAEVIAGNNVREADEPVAV
jgi:isoleucyl-tRNA synthetase